MSDSEKQEVKKIKKVRQKQQQIELLKFHIPNNKFEVGIDEAGRGPLFGRVYAAGVIMPHDLDCSCIKDSKKFTSEKKLLEVAEFIKQNAIVWDVAYRDEKTIDNVNILQATFQCMHDVVRHINNKCNIDLLLVDGDKFKPFVWFDKEKGKLIQIPYVCSKGGDNTYVNIAAASILAKTERDKYIQELCESYPELEQKYKLLSNKGYGTKLHLEGIEKYGISEWHRKSFKRCECVKN